MIDEDTVAAFERQANHEEGEPDDGEEESDAPPEGAKSGGPPHQVGVPWVRQQAQIQRPIWGIQAQ
jgi:hypothetical protein